MLKNKKSSRLTVGLLLLAPAIFAVAHLERQAEANEASVSTNQAVDNTSVFIQNIAPQAVAIANAHDLYPSVMIAQAIHESNSGLSGLAANYNNLFGIKGSYQGQFATLQTWEDDGSGNAYTISAAFRSYPSWAASLEDYAQVLSNPLYAGVHRSATSSYLEATGALTGTYATDTNYASRLNYYIEAYGLTAYDNGGVSLSSIGGESSTLVWNSYRSQYTSQEILDQDQAWANRF